MSSYASATYQAAPGRGGSASAIVMDRGTRLLGDLPTSRRCWKASRMTRGPCLGTTESLATAILAAPFIAWLFAPRRHSS